MPQSNVLACGTAGVVIAAEEPQVVRRVAAGLETLSLPYRIVRPCASEVIATPRGAVYCLGSPLVAELAGLPGPTIVLLYGARLPDEAVARLQGRRMSTLHLNALTPTSLLRAVISALSGSEVDSFAEQLVRFRRFDRTPPGLVTAFLQDPSCMARLADLRRALAPLSREAAQGLVRTAGFSRAEHLFTALRCAVWILLTEQGLSRKETEHYLGISDRTSFRRACRRAGVPTLSGDLRAEAFES